MSPGPFRRSRREVPEILVVPGLNAVFLAVIALVLWPLGRAPLALRLALGYAVFWLVVWASVVLLSLVEKALRVDPDERYRWYVGGNLAVSAVLVAGWSAFAALAVRGAAAGAPVWIAVVLYGIGFLSSYLAFAVATSFYQGSVYKVVCLPLSLVAYLAFCLWPAAAQGIFGWLFALR